MTSKNLDQPDSANSTPEGSISTSTRDDVAILVSPEKTHAMITLLAMIESDDDVKMIALHAMSHGLTNPHQNPILQEALEERLTREIQEAAGGIYEKYITDATLLFKTFGGKDKITLSEAFQAEIRVFIQDCIDDDDPTGAQKFRDTFGIQESKKT